MEYICTYMQGKNIHPIFEQTLQRADKEKLLNQKSKVIWFTGLSGSGKSTIAIALEKALFEKGFITQLLDGDNVRAGINNNLGFSEEDRQENIRRIAEVANLFVQTGVICFCSFVSPTKAIRQTARSIIGESDFIEIYVNTPIAICEQRDVKGLYKKARAGEIKDFTGIHQPFEVPENPDMEVKTENRKVEEIIKEMLHFLLPKIQYIHE
ncbi:MAG: adenylyl-sulfate kinase [Vicingaceae bacterium]|nr:MAG: adenylyl-sulfate kinase [Vicingaceae bacterium]